MGPSIEREVKVALPGRFSIPSLTLGDGKLTVEPMPELVLRATYFDTSDLRLARHGATLRYRTGDDGGPRWTLKLPKTPGGGVIERAELDMDGAGREPPDAARSLVTAFTRREPLVAVATLRTRRRRHRLLSDGDPMAELADDEVSVIEGRRVVSRFRELEVEALADGVDLEGLADQLRGAGATDAEPIPKVVRALGSRATAPADTVPSVGSADPTMAGALVVSLASALARLVHNDPLARLGEEEGVHQVRVALRRLRSDLRTLGDAVDPAWRSGIELRLRDVAHGLGEARDLDVLIGSLRRDVDPGVRSLGPLFRSLESRRAQAYAQMRATLEVDDYPSLLDALVDAIASPPVGPTASAESDVALPAAVLQAWRRLERRAEDLAPSSSPADFHAARVAAKRARYAAELAADVLSDPAASGAAGLAGQAERIQDVLGTIQDAAVAEHAIRETLKPPPKPSPSFSFEAGRLVERQRQRAAEARQAFVEVWALARRRRWRRWAK